MDITRENLARFVDHTLLKPEATAEDVSALIDEALELGTFSVCVSPSMLPILRDYKPLAIATVVGFPSGKHTPETKAAEAQYAVIAGADEIDMVIDLGNVMAGRLDRTEQEIRMVKQACGSHVLKVIIESAVLSDEQIIAVCEAAERAGADFVKTSTGFHPAGGASVHAVSLMAATVGGRLGVKASGGIRTFEDAKAMIGAGATRLGLSATRAVLDGAAK